MDERTTVSRRRFMGGLAALGVGGVSFPFASQAQSASQAAAATSRTRVDEYDAFAKLASNENPYGPPESVMKAMTQAFKYANRYNYPDADVVQVIATHHGVTPEHVMLGAGSGEILDVVGTAFLVGGKKVVGVEPSYTSVYQHATSIRAGAIAAADD